MWKMAGCIWIHAKAGQIGGHWNAGGKPEAITEIINIASVGSEFPVSLHTNFIHPELSFDLEIPCIVQ